MYNLTENKKYIYKFMPTGINDFRYFETVLKGNAHFSKPNNFNDPFDTKFWVTKDTNQVQAEQFYEEYINHPSYLSCFSLSYKSILMWSHYADKHKGVCVVYDKQEINNLVDNNKLLDMAGEVVYQTKAKLYDPYLCLKKKGEDEYFDDMAENILFQKYIDWAYEKEYRIIFGRPKLQTYLHKELKKGDVIVNFIKPVAVLLGIKMDKDSKEQVQKKINKLAPEIKIKEMEIDKEYYQVNIKK